MAVSVERSSTTSGTSAAKPRASKRSAKRKPTPDEKVLHSLFAELARIAEMSAVERRLRDSGFRAIAGTDEVGRGCLAGPVVAAAVILDDGDAEVLAETVNHGRPDATRRGGTGDDQRVGLQQREE